MSRNGRDVRARTEAQLERLGAWIAQHPWRTIVPILVVALGLASQLPNLKAETSLEAMLLPTNPSRVAYDAFRAQFGRDEFILVALRPPEVFDLEFLEMLRQLHQDIENEVPHLDEVTSLVNARSTRGEEDTLIVEDLLEDWPTTPEELAAVRKRALENPLYRDMLISEDGATTSIVIQTQAYSSVAVEEDPLAGFDEGFETEPTPAFITGWESSEVAHAVIEVVDRYRSPAIEVHVAGTPIMVQLLQEYMFANMRIFAAVAMLTIAVLLGAIFRRPVAVLLPLLVVALSLMCTMGAMSVLGYPITFGTQILPPFLIAVGVGYAVHVLAIFFQQLEEEGRSKEDSIAHALGHSGLAVIMTGLTTIGGMASFSAATLLPIHTLGIFAPLGVAVACTLSLLLLPALLALTPIRRHGAQLQESGLAERILVSIGDFAVRRPWWVLAPTAALLIAALPGIPRLYVSHNPLHWLQEGAAIRQGMEFVDAELAGPVAMEVVIDAGHENGLVEPEVLHQIDAVAEHIMAAEHEVVRIGRTLSLTDVVKEIHQALNENQSEFYAIPEDRNLVAQELLLFENTGSDDLEDVVDSQFSMARLSLTAHWNDSLYYRDFLDEIRDSVAELAEPARVEVTGLIVIMSRTVDEVLISLARSYVIALAIIIPLMIFLIGNLRIGLASMVPNLIPIALILGLMGWIAVPMDMFTMLVGGVAIGLVVDDTIHFFHGFRREFAATGDTALSVRTTLRTTGRALLFTSLVLTGAFLIYTLSDMQPLQEFGWLTALAVATAFILDVLVAPALLSVMMRSDQRVPMAVGQEVHS